MSRPPVIFLPVGPLVIMGEAVLSQGHGLGAILPRCPGTGKVRQSPRAQAASRQLWPLLWNPVLIRLKSTDSGEEAG